MITEALTIDWTWFDARQLANEPNERTPGLHLSDIYKSLLIEIDPKRFGADSDDDEKLVLFEMGFSVERMIQAGLSARTPGLHRPGEIIHQPAGARVPIISSPDGLDIEPQPWELTEYKATKMSARQPIEDRKFWHYFVQMKGYIYVLNAEHGLDIRSARLTVVFINGDYSKGPATKSLIRSWRFTFTDEELTANFAMLMKHARKKGML